MKITCDNAQNTIQNAIEQLKKPLYTRKDSETISNNKEEK